MSSSYNQYVCLNLVWYGNLFGEEVSAIGDNINNNLRCLEFETDLTNTKKINIYPDISLYRAIHPELFGNRTRSPINFLSSWWSIISHWVKYYRSQSRNTHTYHLFVFALFFQEKHIYILEELCCAVGRYSHVAR